jgi:hypothetical protein
LYDPLLRAPPRRDVCQECDKHSSIISRPDWSRLTLSQTRQSSAITRATPPRAARMTSYARMQVTVSAPKTTWNDQRLSAFAKGVWSPTRMTSHARKQSHSWVKEGGCVPLPPCSASTFGAAGGAPTCARALCLRPLPPPLPGASRVRSRRVLPRPLPPPLPGASQVRSRRVLRSRSASASAGRVAGSLTARVAFALCLRPLPGASQARSRQRSPSRSSKR